MYESTICYLYWYKVLAWKKAQNGQKCSKKSSAIKITKNLAAVCSLFTNCLIDATKNKHYYYTGKDCMKKYCEDLKEHATKIKNYEKNKWHH